MGAAVGLLQIGSGLLGAYSAIAGGQAAAASHNAAAAAAEQNARTEKALSDEALSRGARSERDFRRRAEQQAATQESQLAASGATLSGSALTIMGDTRVGIEEDVMSLRYNVAQERWGHDVNAVNYGNQAAASRAAAKNARTAGLIGAGTSLLGTAANIWGGATPTSARYTSGNGITVTPMYEGFYYGKHNTFGTIADNLDYSWYNKR